MKPYYSDKWVTIYHGDCREVLPQLDVKVGLVLTDPPYAKDFDYVWDILGDIVPSSMAEGSSMITLCGQYQLPRVINALSKYLEYHWICIIPNHLQPIMFGWNIKVCQKPALWFTKGKITPHILMTDNLAIVGKGLWDYGRASHKWGQSEEMALKPIIQLTQDGEIILDPFLGSGTTAYCAKKLNRCSIGIEIEEKYCEIAAKRCCQEVMELV